MDFLSDSLSQFNLVQAGIVGMLAGLLGMIFMNLRPYDGMMVALWAFIAVIGGNILISLLLRYDMSGDAGAITQTNVSSPLQNLPHGATNGGGLFPSVIPQ